MNGETVVTDEVVDHSIQGIWVANTLVSLNITLNQMDNAVEFGVREFKYKCPGLKCATNQCFFPHIFRVTLCPSVFIKCHFWN